MAKKAYPKLKIAKTKMFKVKKITFKMPKLKPFKVNRFKAPKY